MSVSVLILIAIVVSVALGYLLKINTGLFGMIFAYLFGVFALGMTPGEVTGTFSLPLFFTIFSIIFFYGFAINNGTLEQISRRVINAFGKFPWALPFICYFLCAFISGIGPGPWAVFAFMSPLVFQIAKDIKMHSLIAAEAVIGGGVAGALTPFGSLGGVTKNLIASSGFEDKAAEYTNTLLLNTFIGFTVIFTIVYIIFKGYKVGSTRVDVEPFTKVQKKNMWLIVAMLALCIVPAALTKVFPDSSAIAMVAKAADVNYISIIGAVLAIFLKLGDEKAALNRVPWGTIIMLCGMGMLVAVAVKGGAVELLSGLISENISPTGSYVLFTVVSGVMSMFTSTVGVVMPALYPVIPAVVENIGASATVLLSVILLGAATGVSPLASGGIALAGIQDEAEKAKVYNLLFLLSFISLPIIIVLAISGILR